MGKIIKLIINNKKTTLKILGVIAYAITYIFILSYDLRADPTDKSKISWLVFLSIYSIIPSFLALSLLLHNKFKDKFTIPKIINKIFSNKVFIYLPVGLVILMPLMDIFNYYFNWGYIVPGTWSSFGLMILCYLLIINNKKLNFKIIFIAILGSYLFLSGWEFQYLTRYMVRFMGDPLSFSNAVYTSIHVLTTLPFALFCYFEYKPKLTKISTILFVITIFIMFIIASTKQFSIDWVDGKWINTEPSTMIYCLNRFTKVTLALAIASLKFNDKDISL
jgi:hypothetical protein